MTFSLALLFLGLLSVRFNLKYAFSFRRSIHYVLVFRHLFSVINASFFTEEYIYDAPLNIAITRPSKSVIYPIVKLKFSSTSEVGENM